MGYNPLAKSIITRVTTHCNRFFYFLRKNICSYNSRIYGSALFIRLLVYWPVFFFFCFLSLVNKIYNSYYLLYVLSIHICQHNPFILLYCFPGCNIYSIIGHCYLLFVIYYCFPVLYHIMSFLPVI